MLPDGAGDVLIKQAQGADLENSEHHIRFFSRN